MTKFQSFISLSIVTIGFVFIHLTTAIASNQFIDPSGSVVFFKTLAMNNLLIPYFILLLLFVYALRAFILAHKKS